MVALTKSQAKDVLKSILTRILEDDEDDGTAGPIQLALGKAKVKGILGVNSMSTATLEKLSHDDPTIKLSTSLEKGEIGLLTTFRAFIFYRASTGDPIDNVQKWNDLSLEDFQNFRVSKEWFTISENPGNVSTPSFGKGQMRDLVADFKRGIKRDISFFPTLKQDKQWDVWHRATQAQTRAQDLMEILQDPPYVPVAPADQGLFAEKQKYMYAVFERTLLSDKGKALVREHTADFNAQAVYKEICAYALKSTKATLDSSTMLTYITSSRLGDSTWKSGTHAYLLHWQDQIRKYEAIIPPSDHFAPGQKGTMLENAVQAIPDLRQVQIQSAHDHVRSGKPLTYEQYVSLLLSAAQIHDSELGDTKTSKSRGQRQVYSYDRESQGFKPTSREV
jgi:hypothetical protein